MAYLRTVSHFYEIHLRSKYIIYYYTEQSSMNLNLSVNEGTLFSILSHEYQRQMKYSHSKAPSIINKYYNAYIDAINKRDDPGIIIKIALDSNIAPCLVAKLILQKHYDNLDCDNDNLNINKYLRDTTLINNSDLAYEVFLVCSFVYLALYSSRDVI